jgi:preprotein translocase subunit YajC
MHPNLAIALVQDNAAPPTGGGQPPGPGQQGQGGSMFDLLIPFALCIAVFWFVMIRPEQKQRKKLEAMRANLKKGDKVITTSGLHGSVTQVQDGVVTLQVDEGVRLKYAAAAIQTVLEESAETK